MIADELLAAYAAGELTEAEREEVDAALAGAPDAQRELSRYEQLVLLLAAAAQEDLEAPGDLQARIARRVAVKAYMNLALDLASSIVGAYGRALIYYLRLG
ncbi:MAG: zf-HC2 domain-containing protein [Chloroflexota bacterium]|nr:zf-HC2 domain-containing protein [Chloroflexota bacterium]